MEVERQGHGFPETLTDQERKIIRFASYGHKINEIAAMMHLSPETIKSHRRHILDKLDAKNITHAVALCYEHGVFALSDQVA